MILEPLWPQGLGSNRGFHSALDAAWAIRALQEGGVESALIERAFCYDVMLHSTFAKPCVQPGAGWTADAMTRYAPSVVKGTMMAYEDAKSKRTAKGRTAIPPRYLTLIGASLATLGASANPRAAEGH